MNDVFWTSDTHFDHQGSLRFRPQFSSLDEMHETIVERWNSVVSKNSVVWHLGDFGFKFPNFRKWTSKLNGSIHLILGNHDPDWPWSDAKIKESGFASVKQAHYLRLKAHGIRIYMHHYAQRTWRSSCDGSWHLFGHSHGDLPDYNRSTDVGVDAWDFYPVSIQQLIKRFDGRPETDHHLPPQISRGDSNEI